MYRGVFAYRITRITMALLALKKVPLPVLLQLLLQARSAMTMLTMFAQPLYAVVHQLNFLIPLLMHANG